MTSVPILKKMAVLEMETFQHAMQKNKHVKDVFRNAHFYSIVKSYDSLIDSETNLKYSIQVKWSR